VFAFEGVAMQQQRPAGVTAGVLLCVVGGELLLLAAACVVAVPFFLSRSDASPVFGLAIVFVPSVWVGVWLTARGVQALRGRLAEAERRGRVVVWMGVIGLSVSAVMSLACFAPGRGASLWTGWMAADAATVAPLLTWVINSAGLVVAGVFLGKAGRRPARQPPLPPGPDEEYD
jgi:hypothetical protein